VSTSEQDWGLELACLAIAQQQATNRSSPDDIVAAAQTIYRGVLSMAGQNVSLPTNIAVRLLAALEEHTTMLNETKEQIMSVQDDINAAAAAIDSAKQVISDAATDLDARASAIQQALTNLGSVTGVDTTALNAEVAGLSPIISNLQAAQADIDSVNVPTASSTATAPVTDTTDVPAGTPVSTDTDQPNAGAVTETPVDTGQPNLPTADPTPTVQAGEVADSSDTAPGTSGN
jgi:hypothetical protein